MRRFILLPVIGLSLLAGCPDREVSEVIPIQDPVLDKSIPVNINRKLDIMFVVDNSGSMLAEQQQLVDNFPIGSLMNGGLTIRTGQCHVQRYLRPLLQRIEDGRGSASGAPALSICTLDRRSQPYWPGAISPVRAIRGGRESGMLLAKRRLPHTFEQEHGHGRPGTHGWGKRRVQDVAPSAPAPRRAAA
jgi:hypothetical protein